MIGDSKFTTYTSRNRFKMAVMRYLPVYILLAVLIILSVFFVYLSFRKPHSLVTSIIFGVIFICLLFEELFRRKGYGRFFRKQHLVPPSSYSSNLVMPYMKCIFSHTGVDKRQKAKRSVGDAFLTLQRSGNIGEPTLKFDRLFRKYMSFWTQECTDTTRVALLSLHLLHDKSFIIDNQSRFVKFVNQCFDKKLGGYSVVPMKKASIYGTLNAIEIIKYALCKRKEERLINNRSIEELKENKIKSIEGFLRKCTTTKDNLLYIYDDPNNEDTDSICVLYLTWLLFWTLNKEDSFFELISKNAITSYIKQCEVHPGGGFASNPHQKAPGISATYFGLSLIGGDETYGGKLPEIHNEFFVDKKHKFSNFINRCWNDQMGGFGASFRTLPSLNATYFALRITKLLNLPIEERIKKIKLFVQDSYCDGGGFAFSNYFSPKEPSAHATLWALQIDDFFSKHDWGIIIDIEKKEETKNFLHNLYNRKKGGFSGFPIPLELKNIIKTCPLINHVQQFQPAEVSSQAILHS
ncbi:MAG: prenyltransferase/squalene oxidase repeat-containing protein [Candidatus Brocadiales bacterium]